METGEVWDKGFDSRYLDGKTGNIALLGKTKKRLDRMVKPFPFLAAAL